MVWYADDKNRQREEPNKIVYDRTKSILLYDFYPYATHAPNSIGVFNAASYIFVRWCGLPGQYRWILTSFIAPSLLFIGGDLIPLLKKDGMSVEYRLNLMQCIRLWLLRIALYSVIFCASRTHCCRVTASSACRCIAGPWETRICVRSEMLDVRCWLWSVDVNAQTGFATRLKN